MLEFRVVDVQQRLSFLATCADQNYAQFFGPASFCGFTVLRGSNSGDCEWSGAPAPPPVENLLRETISKLALAIEEPQAKKATDELHQDHAAENRRSEDFYVNVQAIGNIGIVDAFHRTGLSIT